MFTGPVGPVEVFFYWAEAVLGNFYWPGTIGSPLASSPGLSVTLCEGRISAVYFAPRFLCPNDALLAKIIIYSPPP